MPQVLIVDDEPEILEIIQEALRDRGLEVKAAQTDQDALAFLEREATNTSVLVTDINLGEGVTGFDIARKARLLNPALTVVYITGQPKHLERFGVAGSLMIEKPFPPEDLADTVANLAKPTSGD